MTEAAMIGDKCAGILEPCYAPVTRVFDGGDGKRVPLCEKHWRWAERLVELLVAKPELADKLRLEIERAEAGGDQ